MPKDKAKEDKKEDKKKLKEEKKKPLLDISQETKNGIWVVVSFVLAILSGLSFLNLAGRAGEYFNTFAKLAFGWGFFLIPLSLIFLGVIFLKSFSRDIYNTAFIGTSVLILAILGSFYILGNSSMISERVEQGGYLGAILGYPLLQSFGFTAAFIIFFALIIISVLVAMDIPLHTLILKKKNDDQTEDGQQAKPSDGLIIKQGAHFITSGSPGEGFAAKAIEGGRIAEVPSKVEKKDDDLMPIKLIGTGKDWKLPSLDFLGSDKDTPSSGDIAANASIIKRTLVNFGIETEMGEVSVGPTVTQYTLKPAIGVRLAKITALRSDISLALAAHPIRIEAPIPGRSLVGIEVPNKKTALVGLRGILESEESKEENFFLKIGLGRNVAGFPVVVGLDKMPHLLIAGATGTGKSVAINSILLSLLYQHSPDMLKFIMIDPKRVELSLYNDIPHLITPVIVDVKNSVNALKWAVREMERRYSVLSNVGVREIFSYNKQISQKKEPLMPFIIIVIDELADLMVSFGKDIEASVVRLAQMARAVGIHLIVSTQRPSVEVITGVIKANITTRLAFRVVSQVDSRTIIDMSGAETLLGNGDSLFLSNSSSKPRRLQGALVTEDEVKRVVKFLRDQDYRVEPAPQAELASASKTAGNITTGSMDVTADMSGYLGGDDDLYEDAKQVIIEAGKGSASFLQRRLRVGYARAARLLDMLEENGIIGPADGARPREVLVHVEQTAMPNEDVNMQHDSQDGTVA